VQVHGVMAGAGNDAFLMLELVQIPYTNSMGQCGIGIDTGAMGSPNNAPQVRLVNSGELRLVVRARVLVTAFAVSTVGSMGNA
jgi:hypothetical protein